MSNRRIFILHSSLAGVLAVSLLCGCSKIPKLDKVVPDNRTEYRKSTNLPDLEVPPDLTTEAIKDRMAIPATGEGTATFSTYQERAAERQREQEVEKAQTDAIKVIENEHVLAVEGAPVQIWPRLRAFWQERGYTLELDDEELGVMETQWSENQKDLVRDRFKVFAELSADKRATLLYVSHRGEELVPKGEKLVWQPRPRDAAIEREIVEHMQGYLGGESVASAIAEAGASSGAAGPPKTAAKRRAAAAAKAPRPAAAGRAKAGRNAAAQRAKAAGKGQVPRAKRVANARAELISAGEGKVYLSVQEAFPSAWKMTGVALDRAGIPVDQMDKQRGVYYIRMAPVAADGEKRGMWSKFKFWDRKGGDVHQLSLTGVGDKTEVVLLDKDGRWETSDAAGELLSRLHEELNGGQI